MSIEKVLFFCFSLRAQSVQFVINRTLARSVIMLSFI